MLSCRLFLVLNFSAFLIHYAKEISYHVASSQRLCIASYRAGDIQLDGHKGESHDLYYYEA